MFLPLNMCLSLPSLTCQGERTFALHRQNVNKPMVRFSSLLWPTLARSRSLRLTSGLSEEEASWERGSGAGRRPLRWAAGVCRGASLPPAPVVWLVGLAALHVTVASVILYCHKLAVRAREKARSDAGKLACSGLGSPAGDRAASLNLGVFAWPLVAAEEVERSHRG